ncbi:transglutaminase-like domain-containing protein [Rubripirellula amarantea]|uniref:Transglutaminase-like superfamily protein n=1 Tax=Rubripirellula amarantea TaxID=2527999 RepID=A0A5C5WRX0_9BACT|nr:transglutaminase-like domain-containing protein [Rubripirellula amarantea]MDA8743009.1 transglutaminase-like domain-containing protein [Rubripirellula amarantea]TWT53644.1 Transglutaminase-like superfamily protein [Rubripirellula amarantea]
MKSLDSRFKLSSFSRVSTVLNSGETAHHGVLTLAGLLIAQVAFVSNTFREWHSVGLMSLVIIIAVVAREFSSEEVATPFDRRLPSNFNITVGILVVLVLVTLWRFPKTLSENPNYIQIGVDLLSHASLFSSLLIWAMYPRRGHVSILFLGMFQVLLCVAAGGVSRSLAAQTTVGVVSCLGFIIGSRIIVSADYLRTLDSSTTSQWGTSADILARRKAASEKRTRAGIAAVVLLAMTTGAVASVTEKMLPNIQEQLQTRLQSSIEAATRQSFVGGMGYVRGSELGAIRSHLVDNPRGIALRIYAEQKPGYLRGTIFDRYSNRKWSSESVRLGPEGDDVDSSLHDHRIEDVGFGTTELQSASGTNLRRFNLRQPTSERVTPLEIRGDPMRGTIVFLPLATRWLEASGRELTLNHHGQVKMGVNGNAPYVAGATVLPPREQLSEAQKQRMLFVRRKQREQLTPLAEELCRNATTTRDKASAISNYFQREFTYGTDLPERAEEEDPLTFFLDTRHPAHCEYFATSTVLLLRCVGVPTRYVTGYVSDEFADVSDIEDPCWVARNRDAHAWTEAYDEVSQTWFAVESTPGRSYHTVDPGSLNSQVVTNGGKSNRSEVEESESWLSRAIGWVLSSRTTDVFFTTFRYLQIVVLVGLVVWLIRRYRSRADSEISLVDRQSRRMLAKVDRVLRRRGFIRATDESLYQFADRLAGEVEVSEKLKAHERNYLEQAAVWMRAFADARYQGLVPPGWESNKAQ